MTSPRREGAWRQKCSAKISGFQLSGLHPLNQTHNDQHEDPIFQSTTRVKPFICTMPMRLDEGWNQIQFNLSDFTRRAYGDVNSSACHDFACFHFMDFSCLAPWQVQTISRHSVFRFTQIVEYVVSTFLIAYTLKMSFHKSSSFSSLFRFVQVVKTIFDL